MRWIVMVAFALLAVTGATGAEIAVCRSPAGYAYYNNQGLVQPKNAGWTKDEITGGVTTLVQLEDGNWDLLFVDAYKRPISAMHDGGRVLPVRYGADSLSVLVVYESVFEFYTFFRERDGGLKYTHFVNKGGEGALISKSSLMIGSCDSIRIDLVRRPERSQ